MKKPLLLIFTILLALQGFGQTGLYMDFNSNSLDPGWKVVSGSYTLTDASGVLQVGASNISSYQNFQLSFNSINISTNPVVNIQVKNAAAFSLRVDLIDANGNSTNSSPIVTSIPVNNNFTTYTYNFSGKFGSVDNTNIKSVVFFFNPSGPAYSGTVYMDNLIVGDSIAYTNGSIHINQAAYELSGPKTAIFESTASSTSATTFNLLNSSNAVVYTGSLVGQGAVPGWTNRYFWVADFSAFQQAGTYTLQIGSKTSNPIVIGKSALFSAAAANIVSFFTGYRSTMTVDKSLGFYGGRTGTVNVYGGYRDAAGDPGKYMTHLSYANYFNPQHNQLVVWSLLRSYELATSSFASQATALKAEAAWGADYLLRNIDATGNYLYMAIFDDWGNQPSTRQICQWGAVGTEDARSANYQCGFREGAGIAIAALARAYRMGISGDSTSAQYLNGAVRLYNNLKAAPSGGGYATNNLAYDDDHTENMIDDYCALMAAIELYKSTQTAVYLTDAGARVDRIVAKMNAQGWFSSDDAGNRPFYHAADEGMPLIALADYMDIDNSKNTTIINTLTKSLQWYFSISKQVTNPFSYVRQYHKAYVNNALQTAQTAFFLPHSNETGYWWQGENARIASLSTAFLLVAKKLNSSFTVGTDSISRMVVSQMDWVLGKNPFDVSMMTGVGVNNYPNYPASTAIPNVKGGICNGITAKDSNETDIEWMPFASTDWNNWRWIEQWLPHDSWYLLAVSAWDGIIENPPPSASFTPSVSAVCQNGSVSFTNTSTGTISSYLWNFGTGATPGTSTSASPGSVTFATTGLQTVTLTVTGPGRSSTSTQTITVNSIPATPTVASPVTYCMNTTASALTATGTSLLWYTAASGGTGNSTAPTPSTTTTGTTNYYVSQMVNSCESPRATIAVTINAVPSAPTVASPVNYCQNVTASALTATGTSLKWYTTATGGSGNSTAPTPSTTTAGTTSYYVSQTTTSCESPRAAIAVTVNATPAAPTVSSPITYCQNATASALTATGTSLKWYTASTGGTGSSTTPTPSTTAAGTTNYYVSQTTSNCESPRATIAVTVDAAPSASNAGTTQNITVTTATLAANSPTTGTGSWSVVSGTGTFANSASASTSVSGLSQGANVFQWTVSSGVCPSSSSTVIINVGNVPAQQTITGVTNVQTNATGITYSVPSTSGVSKTWAVPVNATITHYNADSSQITVDFGTTSGNVTVTESNAFGSTPSSVFVSIGNNPSPQTITGSTYVASNTSATYSITTPSGITNHWSIPAGATITSSNVDSSQVTISFGTSGGMVSVTQTNSFGSSVDTQTISIGRAPVTQTITGSSSVTANETGVTYSVPDNAGSHYTWSLPAGATITSHNADSSQITVSFGTTGGTVSVTETNPYGQASSSTTVSISPATGVITSASQDSYILYPNPFSETVTLRINSPGKEAVTISITDVNGVVVDSSKGYTNEDIVIGNTISASGVYFIQITGKSEVKILKLVKM